MSKSEKAIFTNMCMVYDNENNILVQNRVDPNWPGITFPGGHIHKNESFVESVIREVFEETGLKIKNPVLCGTKQFQTNNDERYVVLLFKTNEFEGELKSSEEGEVFWINKNELENYKLVNDFLKMYEVFESDKLNEFYYFRQAEKWHLKLL